MKEKEDKEKISLEEKIKNLECKLQEKQEDFACVHRAFTTVSSKLNVLQEIQSLIPVFFNLDKLLDRVMDTVLRAMQVEAASLLLVDEEMQELYFQSAKGEKSEAVKSFRLKIGEGIAGWVAEQGEPVAISEVYKDPRFKKEIDQAIGFETKSVLCVPIFARGKIKGVVEVLNKLGDDVFVSDDIDLLSAIAHLTGIMMENLEGIRKTRKKVRKLVKETIRKIDSKISG